MTKQIAVCLPDEIVSFLDQRVADGTVVSRAAMVSRALRREMRREAALADLQILREKGAEDDLDGLVAWTAETVEIDG